MLNKLGGKVKIYRDEFYEHQQKNETMPVTCMKACLQF